MRARAEAPGGPHARFSVGAARLRCERADGTARDRPDVGARADADGARARRRARRSRARRGRRRRAHARSARSNSRHRRRGRRVTSRCARSDGPMRFSDSDLVVRRAMGETRAAQRARPQRSVAPVARLCRDAPMEKRLMEHDETAPAARRARSAPILLVAESARRRAVRALPRAAEILSATMPRVDASRRGCRVFRKAVAQLARVFRRERARRSTCRSRRRHAVPARRVDRDRRRAVRRDDHATASSRAAAAVRRRCARPVLRPDAIR